MQKRIEHGITHTRKLTHTYARDNVRMYGEFEKHMKNSAKNEDN